MYKLCLQAVFFFFSLTFIPVFDFVLLPRSEAVLVRATCQQVYRKRLAGVRGMPHMYFFVRPFELFCCMPLALAQISGSFQTRSVAIFFLSISFLTKANSLVCLSFSLAGNADWYFDTNVKLCPQSVNADCV